VTGAGDNEDGKERRTRAAAIREQIAKLRAGKRNRPTSPREFVEQQTGQPPDEPDKEPREDQADGASTDDE
jgi:hypothetical protein